jgi:hypothetical protein
MRGRIDLSIPSMSEVLYAVLFVVFLISGIALFHTEGVGADQAFPLLFMVFYFSALNGLRIITLPYEEKKYSGIKLPLDQ